MISLDQVLLLEQKVESAVAKIAQLQAENDALRSRCSELTNALSSKSEQLSSFESDQNKIENGILKALDRLNSIENSVLNAAGRVSSAGAVQSAPVTASKTAVNQPVRQAPVTPQAVSQPVIQSNQTNPNQNNVIRQQPVQNNSVVQAQAPIINASEIQPQNNNASQSADVQPGFFDLDQTLNQPSSEQKEASADNSQFDIF